MVATTRLLVFTLGAVWHGEDLNETLFEVSESLREELGSLRFFDEIFVRCAGKDLHESLQTVVFGNMSQSNASNYWV